MGEGLECEKTLGPESTGMRQDLGVTEALGY